MSDCSSPSVASPSDSPLAGPLSAVGIAGRHARLVWVELDLAASEPIPALDRRIADRLALLVDGEEAGLADLLPSRGAILGQRRRAVGIGYEIDGFAERRSQPMRQ